MFFIIIKHLKQILIALNMNDPLISVIICTKLDKNRISYLREAIKSILDQTYKNYEILLIHNGKNPKIKIPYENKIRYFYTPVEGLAHARNFGVERAKGEYIAFLDDDDIFEKTKLEIQIRNSNNFDVIFTDSKVFNENGIYCHSYFKKMRYFGKTVNIFDYILLEDPFFVPTWLIKRSILLKNKFDEDFYNGHDWELLLRLAKKKYTFKIINEPLAKVRKHSLNMSGDKYWERKFLCYIGILKKTLKSINSKNSRKIAKKQLSQTYFDFAYDYFIRGNLKNSRKYSIKSFFTKLNYFAFKRFFMTFFPKSYLISINKIRIFK